MEGKDTYRTLAKPSSEVLFKDRSSKFFGYAFPVTNEDDIKTHIEFLKKKHRSARHWCYAWQLGTEQVRYRANDDGEPNNSAGQPIYGQIQSFELTDVLVVIVRYFGGTKLGVGGLINAYRTSAQLALDASEIVERTIDASFQLKFGYQDMDKVMRLTKELDANIVSQELAMSCEMVISVRKQKVERLAQRLESLFELEWKQL